MKLFLHPLWLAGFRPFFGLACLAGLLLPGVWIMLFAGMITAPTHAFSMIQWHAHEMFFGFGWAILGGFLLTASKNWVQIRGIHGGTLMYLVGAWLFERAGMWAGGAWPPLLFRISNNLFLLSIVAMLLWTLIRHRQNDSYRDNYFFMLILPLFLLAKNLMLAADYQQIGWSMALGLFRVAFLVLLERTLTQFMKNQFQADILRHPLLDKAIKMLAVLVVFESLLPPSLANWLLLLHVFSFGAMGLIIPAMVIRIAKGHTGRKVTFDGGDKLVLWVMLLAFLARVLMPQLDPSAYMLWLAVAAACWFVCFSILALRYGPYLCQARVDGKVH
ncbi:MAG: NnrS family protein [Proteobacteria bacterium]|nr:NnrS family protein [Pseudomonadota bacterium]